MVIVVDDDKDLLKLIAFSLKQKGFSVQVFERGRTALQYMAKKRNLQSVCLILLDRLLPDMDGLDVLRKLDGQIPVLILSVLSTEKDMLDGLKRGAVDYMAKPFSMSILMEKSLRLIA
jgi:two-component system alkaline phosphatase synthesis response regulator PhoP